MARYSTRKREYGDEELALEGHVGGDDRAAGAGRCSLGRRKRRFRMLERDAERRVRLFRSQCCWGNWTGCCGGPRYVRRQGRFHADRLPWGRAFEDSPFDAVSNGSGRYLHGQSGLHRLPRDQSRRRSRGRGERLCDQQWRPFDPCRRCRVHSRRNIGARSDSCRLLESRVGGRTVKTERAGSKKALASTPPIRRRRLPLPPL